MHINFVAVYQGAAASLQMKTQTPHIGFFSALKMRSRTTNTFAHTQVFKIHKKYIWFCSCEVRRLNQSRSIAVIPNWVRREERLSRSEFNQLFRIDSDTVLHMNLIHWIRFGSYEVRRLNRA